MTSRGASPSHPSMCAVSASSVPLSEYWSEMTPSATILKRVRHEACNDGRPPIQYRIQLVDEPLIDEAAAFMIQHFIPHENIVTALGVHLDKEAIEDIEPIWKNFLSEKISLAAFLEDDQGHRGAMISCNVLKIEKKVHLDQNVENHSGISCRTEVWRKILQTLEDVEAKGDVFKHYDCSAYIHAMGLAVAPEHKRRGIAVEMLLARGEVCRMTGIPISATVFTGEASQKAAVKCGYKTLSELDLTTYRINDQIVFQNVQWPVLKWMVKRYY